MVHLQSLLTVRKKNKMEEVTIKKAQKMVDDWIQTVGVRYFNELTNMAILTEEVGEVAREVYEERSAGMFEEVVQCAAVAFAWAEAYLNRNSGVALDEE